MTNHLSQGSTPTGPSKNSPAPATVAVEGPTKAPREQQRLAMRGDIGGRAT